MIRYQVEGIHV